MCHRRDRKITNLLYIVLLYTNNGHNKTVLYIITYDKNCLLKTVDISHVNFIMLTVLGNWTYKV